MAMESNVNISIKLWKVFWLSSALPLLLFLTVVLTLQLGFRFNAPGDIRIIGILLLVLSVTFGVALPVFFRTVFHSKYVKHKSVSISEYLSYQRGIITVCSTAVISASISYLFIVSPLYMYGSILAALYGVYSAIPFNEKIMKELKIYKLEKSE